MGLRSWIAEILDPETAKKARRYEYLRSDIGLAHRWLSVDFPDIRAVIDWLNDREVNRFGGADERPLFSAWHPQIQEFREQLRHRAKATP